MAVLKKCPHCNVDTECIKKGTYKGKQRWLCKRCKRSFLEEITQGANAAETTAGTTPQRQQEPRRTRIIVNGITIAEINSKLTRDEALQIINAYVRSEGSIRESIEGDTMVFQFEAKVGTKG